MVANDTIPWSPYIPHSPTTKQLAALSLDDYLEVLFGGAAGGAKSDWLLMSALQFAQVPSYAAIIFRRTFTDLALPGALIPRSHEWLGATDAHWDGTRHQWTYPSGATLAFGYLSGPMDRYRYQGSEFQFIGFDELTQFPEEDYLYLHSRLRRKANHAIPLRIRSASNPGGIGHPWVKNRWAIKMVGDKPTGFCDERPFVPSFLEDNPHLDVEEYNRALGALPPIERARLRWGNWDITADGRFRWEWLRRYSVSGPYYVLGPGMHGETVAPDRVEIFSTVDPAGTARDVVPRGKRAPSRSVISTFARTLDHNHLLWLNCLILSVELPTLLENIRDVYEAWKPVVIGIENAGPGLGLYQQAKREGLPIKALSPKGKDKLTRSADAQNRMSEGQIWLPETAPWLDDVTTEVFTWTGDPDEPDDIIDTLSYAATYVSSKAIRHKPRYRAEGVRVAPSFHAFRQ